jgi:hypothetical protein
MGVGGVFGFTLQLLGIRERTPGTHWMGEWLGFRAF